MKPQEVTKQKASVAPALSFMRGWRLSVAPVTEIAPITPFTAISPVTMIPAFVPALIAAVAVIAPIFITVFIMMAVPVVRLVPAGFHEIHRAIAGVVPVAIPGPVLRVSRRNVQIHRFDRRAARFRGHHYRLSIDDLGRRGIAELHLAVDTRADFTADSQVDDGRPGTGWQTGERQGGKDCG